MPEVFISLRRLKLVMAIGIAVLAMNVITLQYFATGAADDPVDMTVLQGHHIAIDPGHGGIDDGASGNGITEKEINLAISLKLADILRSSGAQVTLTRENDIDYYTKGKGGKRNDLLKRVGIINESGAELFISIHVNSIRGGSLFGAQVFYGGKYPSSKVLAETMQQQLRGFPPGNKRQAKQDMDIIVLNASDIPGVLVETGFLSNRNEAQKLLDTAYQQKMAEHIAKALAYHLNQNVAR